MSPGAKRVWGQSATPVSEEVKRRFSRLARYMMVFTPVMLILTFMPIDTGPWVWIKLAILAIGTIILIVWATRFSLWQRDEYWRERGKDPKHPERLPEGTGE
jgi:heme O synthase-like polyprenyltransferase